MVENATTKVLTVNNAPCSANKWMRVRIRRCASIPNAMSSISAASKLINCADSGRFTLTLQQEVSQHTQHCKHECHAEKFRSAEYAHFRRHGLEQSQPRSSRGDLGDECRNRERHHQPLA